MAGEIIADILGAVIEVALGAAGESKRYGCLIFILLLAFLGGLIYFVSTIEPKPDLKGIITDKLSKERVLVTTKKGNDVITISKELYINKKIGDSIIIPQ